MKTAEKKWLQKNELLEILDHLMCAAVLSDHKSLFPFLFCMATSLFHLQILRLDYSLLWWKLKGRVAHWRVTENQKASIESTGLDSQVWKSFSIWFLTWYFFHFWNSGWNGHSYFWSIWAILLYIWTLSGQCSSPSLMTTPQWHLLVLFKRLPENHLGWGKHSKIQLLLDTMLVPDFSICL